MPIKAKPLHLEKPQAPMTTTPAAVAQAALDSQLLNRQPHPYSHLESTDSCIPDLGDDCVACLDQDSVQRPGSASHSGPTLLPAIQQPIPQGPAEVRTSTMPDILAAIRPSVQPHQRSQTQLAQHPALSDMLSSRHSAVQRQAAELEQVPDALPHPVPQKLLKVHLVSNAGDAEAQAHEHREKQAEEQHGKQIQAQEQHEQLVQANQASQKQTPVIELQLPLEQMLPRPSDARAKQKSRAAVRPACPPTKQLSLPEQLRQKLQAHQISKPAVPLEVQPNLKQVSQMLSLVPEGQQLQVSPNCSGAKQVAELQQLSQHDLSNSLKNAQTRLASSALLKAALKTASVVVTGSLPRKQSQESLAPSAAAFGMPSTAEGSSLASSKKHTLELTSHKGARSQSPPSKRRCIKSDQAEPTSQRDKAVNKSASGRTLKAPAIQSPQSHETMDQVSKLPSSEAVSTPSVTESSRSSTCVSDSSFSCGSFSGSMLTTSNSSSDSLSNGGYGGLSWQVNKSLTNEDLSSLKSKDITVTYTWDPSNAVKGEVAVKHGCAQPASWDGNGLSQVKTTLMWMCRECLCHVTQS